MDQYNSFAPAQEHQVSLSGRSHLEVTGVTDVDSFDDTVIDCFTSEGRLSIHGTALQMHHLDLDGCVLIVNGTIDSLTYTQVSQKGLLGRMFR